MGVAVVGHSSGQGLGHAHHHPAEHAGRRQAPAQRGVGDPGRRRIRRGQRRHHHRDLLGAAVRPLPRADPDPGRRRLLAAGHPDHHGLRGRRTAGAVVLRDASPCRPGTGGVLGAAGQTLAQAATVHFGVAPGSTLRLQQLLAQLGYLPVSFTPAGPLSAPQELAQPQEGTFAWRFAEPAALQAQWTPGTSNVVTKGAVMGFEDKHGMTTDGVAGPGVWTALLADVTAGTIDTDAYNYVYVSKSLPERTTVYSNGAAVYSTLANTGVAAAPTASGTFPVFEHVTVTTMRGTNPDGSKYVDPGIPWVSYFNGGDALHGFVRSSYGYPQSDGCVEMPPANAGQVYPYTPIGTLVTVS